MLRRLAWDCHGSLGGCHPHGHQLVGTGLIQSGKSTGLGVIAVIFLFLLVRGLATGKWG
jgi:hypothetical protein